LRMINMRSFKIGMGFLLLLFLISVLIKIFTVDPHTFLNNLKDSGFRNVKKIEITRANKILKIIETKSAIMDFFDLMKNTEIWEPQQPLHTQRFNIKIYYADKIIIFECATEGCNANEVHIVVKGDNVYPSDFKNIKLFDWAKNNNIICGF